MRSAYIFDALDTSAISGAVPSELTDDMLTLAQVGDDVVFWPHVSKVGVGAVGANAGFHQRLGAESVIAGNAGSLAYGTKVGLKTMIIGAQQNVPRVAVADFARGFCLAGIAFSRFGIGANSVTTGASWYVRNNNATGKMTFRIGAYTSSEAAYLGPLVTSDVVPHPIVLNYDRTAGTVRLYVDGALQMDVLDAALIGATVHPEAQVGLVANNTVLQYDRYPEVFIAARPLAPDELTALHSYQQKLMQV